RRVQEVQLEHEQSGRIDAASTPSGPCGPDRLVHALDDRVAVRGLVWPERDSRGHRRTLRLAPPLLQSKSPPWDMRIELVRHESGLVGWRRGRRAGLQERLRSLLVPAEGTLQILLGERPAPGEHGAFEEVDAHPFDVGV